MKKYITKIFLGDNYKIIKVKSWKPYLGPYGVEWPVLLVDYNGMRQTSVPVWDKFRFKFIFNRIIGKI